MTSKLRPGMPPLPAHMRDLPIDKRGFVVPAFVAMVDGAPDHRIVEPKAMQRSLKEKRCWICGKKFDGTARLAFVVGPMCVVNRVTSEPPSHFACATFSAQACPFLSRPHAHRRSAGMPDEVAEAPGVGLKRNPGMTAIYVTRSFRPFKVPAGNGAVAGVLFRMGEPERVYWWRDGRPATRAECVEAIDAGLPALVEIAEAESPEAVAELYRYIAATLPLLPHDEAAA